MEPLYRLVIATALLCFRLLRWRVTTSGLENIPTSGPAIIASNHIGLLDFMFIGSAAQMRGRLVRFIGVRSAFEHRIYGPLLRRMHHIPVDPSNHPGASFQLATEALRRGELVGVNPEGHISRSFVPAAGKTGAVRMAIETGAPLIPAAVWGSQRLLAPGHRPRFPRGVAVASTFGQPVDLSARADVGEATLELMARITALVNELEAGYSQRPRTRVWWMPAHLGGGAPPVAAAGEGPIPGI